MTPALPHRLFQVQAGEVYRKVIIRSPHSGHTLSDSGKCSYFVNIQARISRHGKNTFFAHSGYLLLSSDFHRGAIFIKYTRNPTGSILLYNSTNSSMGLVMPNLCFIVSTSCAVATVLPILSSLFAIPKNNKNRDIFGIIVIITHTPNDICSLKMLVERLYEHIKLFYCNRTYPGITAITLDVQQNVADILFTNVINCFI